MVFCLLIKPLLRLLRLLLQKHCELVHLLSNVDGEIVDALPHSRNLNMEVWVQNA
jgi:hypothetical protein|tara:strand:+ start:964 stop:1128 length:165 start_codon:yes stop_codon:yes gene_type:complete